MKTQMLPGWVTVGILALAWTLLSISSRPPCPHKERERRQSNEFKSDLQNGVWFLKYKYHDSLNQVISIECSIKDEHHSSLKNSFGLFRCTERDRLQKQLGDLAACLEGEVIRSDQKGEIQIRRLSGFSDWDCGSYVNSRGFKSDRARDKDCKALFSLDYAGLATRTVGALDNCARRLEGKVKNLDDWLAFFQAMPTPRDSVSEEEVDVSGRKKWIGGLLVPTQVMIDNIGDCDSKALAFAALQRDRKHLVMFRSTKLLCPASSEGHVFVGMEINSRPGHKKFNLKEVLSYPIVIDGRTSGAKSVRINVGIGVLLEYDIMEITGPGITLLGEFDAQKYGTYYGIPLDI